MDHGKPISPKLYVVSSTESYEFTQLTRSLTRSCIIGLDAEWRPGRHYRSTFPSVSLLQLACQFVPRLTYVSAESEESVVFLLDLASIPLSSIWELLRDVFVSPNILKLGFRFKQDLIYLSSTFSAHGCDPGFGEMEPYMDITSIYNLLQHKPGSNVLNDLQSLATICEKALGISLSKELQCSDWSRRPLTEEQKMYAALDAHCLLLIFEAFHDKVIKEGTICEDVIDTLSLKENLEEPDSGDCGRMVEGARDTSKTEHRNIRPMDECLKRTVRKYGERILLRESDRKPKSSKGKVKIRSSMVMAGSETKQPSICGQWQGVLPRESYFGEGEYPKFLCDVMVEGLAKHLRCVGLDAAVPLSKKSGPRDLLDQACKEKRVILTRDAKLLKYQYLVKDQIYKLKNLLKTEQLIEVIETFRLKISEDQLMSRCTKCNGRFIQKPLTMEDALQAAKGFQRIPNCLFHKNLEFWQCVDCNQLYWEGTQYRNAVQKFITVCKLKG